MKLRPKFSLHRLLFLFMGVAFSFYIWTGCTAEPPENSRAAQIKRGQALFNDNCSSCHGKDAKGGGIASDTLQVKPADLTKISKRRGNAFPVSEIARIIDGRQVLPAHGTREMPIWGEVFEKQENLTKDELKGKMGELIAYLITIQE